MIITPTDHCKNCREELLGCTWTHDSRRYHLLIEEYAGKTPLCERCAFAFSKQKDFEKFLSQQTKPRLERNDKAKVEARITDGDKTADTIQKKKQKIHLKRRYYFGYGYACIQAVGKGKKEKMTSNQILVTCKNCKARYCNMKKQGLRTTINELHKIADDLEKELRVQFHANSIDQSEIYKAKILVSIINKEGLSDTWEFEK